MSRREDRGSESKRHRSRFDRESSPKRSRRDGKLESERLKAEPELEKDRLDRELKHRHRLHDPLPLEAPLRHDSKVESGIRSKESENKSDGHQGSARHPSDPNKLPQSRTYFQHDDRSTDRLNGRGFSRRTENERGWWRDPKEQLNDRSLNKISSSYNHQKDEKATKGSSREDDRVWRHNGYFELEADPKPTVRKRPSFREQKIPTDPGKIKKDAADPGAPNRDDYVTESRKRDERGHASRHFEGSERPFSGERDSNKTQTWSGNFFPSRDRHNASSSRYNRGKDRFTARPTYRPTTGRVEKWKHDLYDESNKSPPPKNDEEQISKIEALLAS